MTSWDELQPRFRMTVLRERRAGRTIEEIAEASHLGRTTVYRLMAGQLDNPRPAVRECVERFVETFLMERSNADDSQD